MTIKAGVLGCVAGVIVVASSAACTGASSGSGSGSAAPRPPAPTASPARSHAPSPAPSSHAATTAPTHAGRTAAPPPGQPVPPHFVPVSTTFVSADDGWVLGTDSCRHRPCSAILRTRDGGRSWRAIPAPQASEGQPDEAPAGGAITRLRFADQSNGWVGVHRLWATHDGGRSWQRQSVPGSVGAIETGGGYVFITSDTRAATRVYASPIGRSSWRAITPELPDGGDDVGLTVVGPDWFVATPTGVYHGHGFSSGTDRLPDPCPRADTGSGDPKLAAADARHVDAVCVGGGAAGTARYELFGSTDGGRDWRAAGKPFRGLTGSEGIADNAHGVLLLAETSAASRIVRTADDGARYTRSRVPAPSGGALWADLGFTTASQAVVVLVDRGLYLSHDSGRTFRRVGF